MTEQVAAKKKREPKPGTRRVTVTMSEPEYKALADLAQREMREPNNMLTFILKGNLSEMIAGFDK